MLYEGLVRGTTHILNAVGGLVGGIKMILTVSGVYLKEASFSLLPLNSS